MNPDQLGADPHRGLAVDVDPPFTTFVSSNLVV